MYDASACRSGGFDDDRDGSAGGHTAAEVMVVPRADYPRERADHE